MRMFAQAALKKWMATLVVLAFALAFAPGLVLARDGDAPFPQWQLDRMLAPIALYPDALLSQVLMAATYPIEVVEAARWSRRNPNLRGDEAVWAVDGEDWDPSVKSLVAFPDLLDTMDQQLDWTRDLGDAFLDQREDVIDTVQALRRRAWAAGNLRSDERVRYLDLGPVIAIEPAQPRHVHVPYYDPAVVYGGWWWSSYPPVRWAPWRGYHAPVAAHPGFRWNNGTGISIGLFFGGFDWPRREVQVVHVNNYYTRTVVVDRTVEVQPRRPAPVVTVVREAPRPWQHDPNHRRGVGYRSPETVQRVHAAPPRGPEGRFDGPDRREANDRVRMSPPDRPEARGLPRFEQRERAAERPEPAPMRRDPVQEARPAPQMAPERTEVRTQPDRGGPRPGPERAQPRTAPERPDPRPVAEAIAPPPRPTPERSETRGAPEARPDPAPRAERRPERDEPITRPQSAPAPRSEPMERPNADRRPERERERPARVEAPREVQRVETRPAPVAEARRPDPPAEAREPRARPERDRAAPGETRGERAGRPDRDDRNDRPVAAPRVAPQPAVSAPPPAAAPAPAREPVAAPRPSAPDARSEGRRESRQGSNDNGGDNPGRRGGDGPRPDARGGEGPRMR